LKFNIKILKQFYHNPLLRLGMNCDLIGDHELLQCYHY